MTHYDVAVVGTGGAGITAALTAKRRGASVAMIERRKIGGECTHYGCVPSKSLIAVAKLAEATRQRPRFGLPTASPSEAISFAGVMDYVQDVVDRIYLGEQPERFEDLGIDVFVESDGARFIDPHRLQVGGSVLEAEYVVLSTGSSPRRVPVLGDLPLRFLDNENVWELREAPESITFLGGGVVAVEIGQALARLGVRVTILERGDRIIRAVDPSVGDLVLDALESDGVRIFTGADVVSCESLSNGDVAVNIIQNAAPKQLRVASVFAALGRIPNTSGLELGNAGIEHTDDGITTDEYLRTTQPNVYAAGDVTSRAKFSHVAGYQGELVVDNMMGKNRPNDLSVLPWAIFTDPEIGHVGLSEEAARSTGHDVNTLRVDATVDRFQTESRTDGFLKVFLDSDDTILGAEGVGLHAGEWVQFVSLAMQNGLSIRDLAETMFVYPTFAEIAKKPFSRYLRTKESTTWLAKAPDAGN
jgi:pyruvate/2-oxoglutarate dehydrogenase complex dihydrolipoamide dehydrogenase (E3) component